MQKKGLKELFDLDGKVAIITGGAGTLGEMHAEIIAEAGGIPILVDIDEDGIPEGEDVNELKKRIAEDEESFVNMLKRKWR